MERDLGPLDEHGADPLSWHNGRVGADQDLPDHPIYERLYFDFRFLRVHNEQNASVHNRVTFIHLPLNQSGLGDRFPDLWDHDCDEGHSPIIHGSPV